MSGELVAQTPWVRHVIDDASRGADGIRAGDIDSDGHIDLVTGWEQGGVVRVCRNPGIERSKERWPSITIGRAAAVEDAFMVDLDNDERLDVVSCSEGNAQCISFHWSPREKSEVMQADRWGTAVVPDSVGLMRWMFALAMDVDGQRGVDVVAGGKGPGAAIGWFESPSDPRRVEEWKWHPWRSAGWVMSLVDRDMDGDGDLDLLFSDRKGERRGVGWLENPGSPTAAIQPWQEHSIGGDGREAMFLQTVDLDRDGLEDVLVAVAPKEILWLRRTDRQGRAWETIAIPMPEEAGTAKGVHAMDIDRDGHLDVLLSCENAKPPRQGLMWLSCHERPHANSRWDAYPLSGRDGVKHDLIALHDLDGDGDLDVVTTEEVRSLGVVWYEQPGP